MTKSRILKQITADDSRMLRKENTFSLLVGVQTENVNMEILVEFPQRADK